MLIGTGAPRQLPQPLRALDSPHTRRQHAQPACRSFSGSHPLICQLLSALSAHSFLAPPDPPAAVADCLLSQNYQIKQRPRPAAPTAAPAAPQPPRQHYAVKQQHGKLGMSIPQQWQPRADAAGSSAEPFPPPQHRGTAGAAGDAAGAAGPTLGGDAPASVQGQQAQQQAAGMDIDQEEI